MRFWLALLGTVPILALGAGAGSGQTGSTPQNGLIAAPGGSGMHLFDPRSAERRLVPGTERADDYQWSADGGTLAFDTGEGDDGCWTDSDVYTVRADGLQLRRVLRDAWSPSWLPDGSGLVAVREVATLLKIPGVPAFENWTVATYATREDGTDPVRLTSFTEAGDDPVAVSPDGDWVAYSSFGVNRVRPDGSGRERIAREQPVRELTWSPDGDWLAFVTEDDNYLVRPDGSGLHRFGRAGDPFEHLAWSPDGSTIAAERVSEVVLVDADSGKERILSRLPRSSMAPSWSPDGKQLVFLTSHTGWDCGDRGGDLWVANADGSSAHRIAKGCWGRPSWLPAAHPATSPGLYRKLTSSQAALWENPEP